MPRGSGKPRQPYVPLKNYPLQSRTTLPASIIRNPLCFLVLVQNPIIMSLYVVVVSADDSLELLFVQLIRVTGTP